MENSKIQPIASSIKAKVFHQPADSLTVLSKFKGKIPYSPKFAVVYNLSYPGNSNRKSPGHGPDEGETKRFGVFSWVT